MYNFGICGDVHGKLGDYISQVENYCKHSLQLGDMGFFYHELERLDSSRHKFLPGNHDNYSTEIVEKVEDDDPRLIENGGELTKIGAAAHRFTHLPPHFIGHFGTWPIPETDQNDPMSKIFYVRGAWSIDHKWRIMGVNLFEREEMSFTELERAVELYKKEKPEFVVTHSAPTEIMKYLALNISGGKIIPTRTGQALQNMFEYHKPKLWVFGHFHQDFDKVIKDTRFICLNELSMLCFDQPGLEFVIFQGSNK